MKKMVTLSIAALMSAATLGMAAPAAAQNGYYDRDGYSSYYSGYDRDDRRYDRRDYRRDRDLGPAVIGMGEHVPDFILRSFALKSAPMEEVEETSAGTEG